MRTTQAEKVRAILAPFCSKAACKVDTLGSIHSCKEYVEATDSYSFLRVNVDCGMLPNDAKHFPSIDPIIEENSKRTLLASVNVDPALLERMAKAFAKLNRLEKLGFKERFLTIEIREGSRSAITFKNASGSIGLLMPLEN